MSSNQAGQSQRKSSSISRTFTFSKVSVTALLIAMVVIAVLIALMSKQQALIAALKQQSYLEDNILATESSINQFTFQVESSAFSGPANYTILKRELQVTVQGISEYLRSSAGQAISPTVLSERDFAIAKEGLNSASARQVAQTTLDLLYTLIELPIADATQRIQQQFSLLPMVNAMQAEENALLLRIQALRNKMLLTTILGAVVIVLWYFIACFFYKSNANKSPKKFGKSKLRLAVVDDDRDLQNKEFLQLISHEFRAPISAIISALELIPNMEEQRTRLIQQAEQSSYRLLNLTNNLTDVCSTNVSRRFLYA